MDRRICKTCYLPESAHDGREEHRFQSSIVCADGFVTAGAVPYVDPYTCKLCGQRIDDGKPCGCGARY